ncbi:hypothetical protein EOT10_15805 [Streptomyces antnestii]|uniref:Bacterial CdiA-CT RNAse A domain-containing protein n=1 Tax=Streptomyces antnestii TaxID=2494256 RepID=A0A437PQ64_9ACTN|nr:hypothetical protein [Streptomyces sp. San01]RVU24468.1 hypothetical protein EOT10_15805 [Streptomyces sp. San01]
MAIGPAQGQQNLTSSPARKHAAVRAIENHIEPDTRRSGEWADEDTGAAVRAFDAKDGHGWVTSSSLKKAHKAWGDQVKSLMNRLSSEKVSLRATTAVLQGTDFGVGAHIRTTSPLDNY